jgi:uncharacterized oligopeptide transporter (OPT) family protein
VPILAQLSDVNLQWLNPVVIYSLDGMSPEVIFSSFARHIGIGSIAMAGIIGIIKSRNIIRGAVGLASKELKNEKVQTTISLPRTQRDIPMKIIAIGVIVCLLVVFAFFFFGVLSPFFSQQSLQTPLPSLEQIPYPE